MQARGGRKKADKKGRLAPGEKQALRKEGIERKRAQRAAGRGLDLNAVDQVSSPERRTPTADVASRDHFPESLYLEIS